MYPRCCLPGANSIPQLAPWRLHLLHRMVANAVTELCSPAGHPAIGQTELRYFYLLVTLVP